MITNLKAEVSLRKDDRAGPKASVILSETEMEQCQNWTMESNKAQIDHKGLTPTVSQTPSNQTTSDDLNHKPQKRNNEPKQNKTKRNGNFPQTLVKTPMPHSMPILVRKRSSARRRSLKPPKCSSHLNKGDASRSTYRRTMSPVTWPLSTAAARSAGRLSSFRPSCASTNSASPLLPAEASSPSPEPSSPPPSPSSPPPPLPPSSSPPEGSSSSPPPAESSSSSAPPPEVSFSSLSATSTTLPLPEEETGRGGRRGRARRSVGRRSGRVRGEGRSGGMLGRRGWWRRWIGAG